MSIRNLDKIFDPHRIAVIGADETPNSVGCTVFRNLIASNYRGVVYPVNPQVRDGAGNPGLSGYRERSRRGRSGRDLLAGRGRAPNRAVVR